MALQGLESLGSPSPEAWDVATKGLSLGLCKDRQSNVLNCAQTQSLNPDVTSKHFERAMDSPRGVQGDEIGRAYRQLHLMCRRRS